MENVKRICFALLVLIFWSSASVIYNVQAQTMLRKALDFDGDGKTDLSVFRPKENKWYIVNSGAGGAVITTQFGDYALDTPAPGDYDGDGKADIAVWRESDGTFRYLQSSNNAPLIRYFGQVGDVPVARDYDADGELVSKVVEI